MKTIKEILVSKKQIEKDIKELISDFQTESGCEVTNVRLITSSVIGKVTPVIIDVELEVHLPRS